jgi:threonine/homoserine/homoserine lactone efflux protein
MGLFYVFLKKVTIANDAGKEVQRFRKRDVAKIFSSGFLINTLNPSVILFWLINATAFAVTHTWNQRLIIFSTCIGVNIVADLAKVLMAGKLRKKLTLHNLAVINKISGVILVGFGLALLWTVVFYPIKFDY